MDDTPEKKEYVVDKTFMGVYRIGDLVRKKDTGAVFVFDKTKYDCDFNRGFERVIEKT